MGLVFSTCANSIQLMHVPSFLYIPVHTVTAGSWAHRTLLKGYKYKLILFQWLLYTDLLGCGSCWLCHCPHAALTALLENCELGSKHALLVVSQRMLPQKGWWQLMFLSTVYRGSKTPGECFVLTRIENGTCTAPVGPGFWVNASVAPSNFHFAWFQDLLHFHNNFCMSPFVMSR